MELLACEVHASCAPLAEHMQQGHHAGSHIAGITSIIRVGKRSKSAKLEEFNLHNQQNQVGTPRGGGCK